MIEFLLLYISFLISSYTIIIALSLFLLFNILSMEYTVIVRLSYTN